MHTLGRKIWLVALVVLLVLGGAAEAKGKKGKGKGGRGIYTFTPENGRTDLVYSSWIPRPSISSTCRRGGWTHRTCHLRSRRGC